MNDSLTLVNCAQTGEELLSRFRGLKRRKGCNIDNIVVFLAVGVINFNSTKNRDDWSTPATIGDVSELLLLPRETARRKLLELEKDALVKRTSYGFLVADVPSWSALMSL